MSEEWDTDVTNYSLEDLAEALGVATSATRSEIIQGADARIRLTGDPALATFFQQAKERLINLTSQDPNKKITRTLNLDSAYRPVLGADNQDSDNFTCTLSERLTGVLSITLLSIELPQTWYTFSLAKGTSGILFQTLYPKVDRTFDASGNLVGQVVTDTVYTTDVLIPDGNYSNLSLMAAVAAALNAVVPTIPEYTAALYGTGPWFALAQSAVDGKLTITYSGYTYAVKLSWYDPSNASEALTNAKANNSLGWELGFRSVYTTLAAPPAAGATVVKAPSLLSAFGTKYVLIKLKDHTSGRLTNGGLSLGAPNLRVDLPTYSKVRRGAAARETATFVNLPQGESALTAKQLYTITAIANKVVVQSGRAEMMTTDLFAKIPMKRQVDWSTYNVAGGAVELKEDGPGKIVVELGGTLQRNKREYAGPVNLSTLTVSIHDDKGNLLGLNGHDWSFTLELETLPPN